MGWVVSATPLSFYPREWPRTRCVGGWVDLRAGLVGGGKSGPTTGFDLRSCYTNYIYIYIYIHIQGLSKRFEHLLLWPPRSPDLTPCDFSYGDTLKTMPTNHHSPKMCVNCKIAFELRCKTLMGTCWSASGRRDYRIDICTVTKGAHMEHLWADFGKLGHLLHYLCVKLYLILTINT